MKKLFIFLAIVTITTASFAQGNINKGDVLLGGTFGFNSTKSDNKSSASSATFTENTTYLSAEPNFGVFVINKLATGLRVSLLSNKTKSKTGPATEEKDNTTLIAPFVRYYFLPSTQKINVFLDGSYSFGSNKNTFTATTPSSSYQQKTNVHGYAAKAGVAMFVVPSVAMEFALGYQSLKYKGKSPATNTGSGENNTFGFNIGLQIHIPCKMHSSSK